MIVFCKIALFCKIWKQEKNEFRECKIQDMTKNIFCHKKMA